MKPSDQEPVKKPRYFFWWKNPETGKFEKKYRRGGPPKKRGPRQKDGKRKVTAAQRRRGKTWNVVITDLAALKPGEAYIVKVPNAERFRVFFHAKILPKLRVATPWQWQVSPIDATRVAITCIP